MFHQNQYAKRYINFYDSPSFISYSLYECGLCMCNEIKIMGKICPFKSFHFGTQYAFQIHTDKWVVIMTQIPWRNVR